MQQQSPCKVSKDSSRLQDKQRLTKRILQVFKYIISIIDAATRPVTFGALELSTIEIHVTYQNL
jgi:hypothetical protein